MNADEKTCKYEFMIPVSHGVLIIGCRLLKIFVHHVVQSFYKFPIESETISEMGFLVEFVVLFKWYQGKFFHIVVQVVYDEVVADVGEFQLALV